MMSASVCTCTLTLRVAPSMGMGTLVANAAGASRREVARTAFRVAFIGDPFRRFRLLNEDAGRYVRKPARCGATLRKTSGILQIPGPHDLVTHAATPCASPGWRAR